MRAEYGKLVSVLRQGPSQQWESFGREDPYFGVCSESQFQRETLGDEARARFFASGERQMDELLADARSVTHADLVLDRVLEYGCGVGRLLIPLGRRARSVVGVDVSPSMLAEARRNCNEFGMRDVELIASDDVATIQEGFDFVYSLAVLQHVPRRAGEQIIAKLVGLLRPGGVGAINVAVRAKKRLALFNAIMTWPLAHNVLNLMRGRKWSYPYMQMNVYDLNRVMLILRDHEVKDVRVKLGPPFGGFEFCTIFFRR
jgi:2-polyprenyl-3-methyl-5-hydroxy-6-metoxy-1,4-benzoquinol methylase